MTTWRASLRRMGRLGRTEMLLFWRNKTAVFTALILPIAMVGFYASFRFDDLGAMSMTGFVVTGVVGLVLLFVVYHNLVSALVARREELVLKRLRTGESRDAEILVATALPAVVVAVVQVVIGVGVGAVVLDLVAPVNVIVLAVGLVGGFVLFVLLAAVSTAFTRSVELAQISTMPVLFACLLGSGTMVPLSALPENLQSLLRLIPLTPVVELIRLGWLGVTDDTQTVTFAGAFGAMGAPLVILVAWIVGATYGLRRWFRWEPRV